MKIDLAVAYGIVSIILKLLCVHRLSPRACSCWPGAMKNMIRRAFACIAIVTGLLLAPAVTPTPVEAVTININIGTSLNNGRGITCAQGERLLRNRGFRDIRRVNCRGRYFVYRGWRGSSRFEIAVRSSNGRVVDVRRIRR
jgi:hypothetical protein